MILKIGSMNLRNNKTNRNGGIRKDGINNSLIISDIIKKENFDILGTQELTRKYKKEIKKNINYKFYGGYRFGSNIISKNIKLIDDFNENNNIITKYKVLKNKTYLLPFLPYNLNELFIGLKKHIIFPRIITILLLQINDKVICSINTHLDYRIESIQKRQLKKLKKIIKKYSNYPIILTGDFNLEVGFDNFDTFIKDMELYNLKRVEINEKTNNKKFKNESAIDHIFIPNDWNIVEKGIKSTNKASDHNYIYTIVEF